MWVKSSERLPEPTNEYRGKKASEIILIWHSPTNAPFVGRLVSTGSGNYYFTDCERWNIEIEHCPFWMPISRIPNKKK